MNPAAIEKAKGRLEKARTILAELATGKSPSYARFQAQWTDFILALNGVYSVLEQGSKVSPQSRQWFGAKKRERREDPLLQYLHQARNADEHGIAPVSRFERPQFQIVPGTGNPDAIKGVAIGDDKIEIIADVEAAKGVQFLVTTPAVFLIPVTDDRFGQTFNPPTTHLGQQLPNSYPLTVATKGFEYVENLVQEAGTLA